MYIISFNQIFSENANILAKRLNINFVTEFNPVDNDLIIVFGSHEQAITLALIQKKIKCKYIIIQSEQYESNVFDNKYYIEILKNNYIMDWSKYNIELMKKHMDIKVYSLYYYDYFLYEETKKERPIDFFFCGAYSVEREQSLNLFKKLNPNYIIEYDFSGNYINQAKLNEKLLNVKYVINIPYYKNNSLETHRINKALSLGCQVISIPSKDLYLNEKYKDYVHFVKELCDFCPLLENQNKKNYKEFTVEYIENQVLHNLNAFIQIEKLNLKNS